MLTFASRTGIVLGILLSQVLGLIFGQSFDTWRVIFVCTIVACLYLRLQHLSVYCLSPQLFPVLLTALQFVIAFFATEVCCRLLSRSLLSGR